jgi:hypothetical protein
MRATGSGAGSHSRSVDAGHSRHRRGVTGAGRAIPGLGDVHEVVLGRVRLAAVRGGMLELNVQPFSRACQSTGVTRGLRARAQFSLLR